jgi:hypothetical protein
MKTDILGYVFFWLIIGSYYVPVTIFQMVRGMFRYLDSKSVPILEMVDSYNNKH